MKFLIGSLGMVALALVLYLGHLATGGEWQRANLKSLSKVKARIAADVVLTDRGGDCELIGTWDTDSRTCRLSRDLDEGETVFLTGRGVTLDGQGHEMKGRGEGDAITISRASDFAVRNLAIRAYGNAIVINYSTHGLLERIDFEDNGQYAIYVDNAADFNTFQDNTIRRCGKHGIAIRNSSGTFILHNLIEETEDAIRLQNSHQSVFVGNELSGNEIEGLDLHEAWRNLIAFNRFLDDGEVVPIISHPFEIADNIFELEYGGNQYALFDSDEEGCRDANADMICDDPFEFQGGVDEMPLRPEYLERFAVPAGPRPR